MPATAVSTLHPAEGSASRRAFANPDVVVRSWYAVATCRELDRKRVMRLDFADRRLVLYRGDSGRPYAATSRCPHLGVDLAHGDVVGEDIRCAMHHYCFGPDGKPTAKEGPGKLPGRKLRTFPTAERFGRVWIFAGPEADFELPGPTSQGTDLRTIRLPHRRFGCHPHLITANVFDTVHLGPLHEVDLVAPAEFTQPAPHHQHLELVARLRSARMRRLTGSEGTDIVAHVSLVGGNLCLLRVSQPISFEVLFAAQPLPQGGARTDTTLFIPRGTGAKKTIQLVALFIAFLNRDREMLNDLRFLRGFTEADETLAKVVDAVDHLPVL